MTPQYYSNKQSERKEPEKDSVNEPKNINKSKSKQRNGRNSIVKENPDSLDSDLMDAVSLQRRFLIRSVSE